ncbi:MAG: methionyl-tRNA formyltransferase [Balneolaceae bacterium]
MEPLKIVFMGSPEFAVPSLNALSVSNHEILTVVSNPDKRRGRGEEPTPTSVKRSALELNLPVMDVDDVQTDLFLQKLKELEPDLLVIVAFRILPPEVLEIPKYGSINLHASLLPKYRGAAPIHWAIIQGESETGCTVFFLNEKVDTGQIIGQISTSIGLMETTGDLYERLKIIGSELLVKCVDQIASGDVNVISQNDKEATPAPKLYKENTRIDFSKNALSVHNFVRGLNPFPKAWCNYDGQKMNIYETEPVSDKKMNPGTLRVEEGRLYAGCGEGAVLLKKLQLPGTKVMSGEEFINGYNINLKLR